MPCVELQGHFTACRKARKLPATGMVKAPLTSADFRLPGAVGWRCYVALAACTCLLLSGWSVAVRVRSGLPLSPPTEQLDAWAMALPTAASMSMVSFACLLLAMNIRERSLLLRVSLGLPFLIATAAAMDYAFSGGHAQRTLRLIALQGNMSLPTSLSVMLLSAAFFVAANQKRVDGALGAVGRVASCVAAGIPYYGAVASLLGDQPSSFRFGVLSIGSITALLLLSTAALLLLDRPTKTLDTATLPSRQLLVSLLPLPLLLPGLVGWVRAVADRIGWTTEASDLALSVAVATFMLVVSLTLAVHWMRRFEVLLIRSRDAEHEARISAEAASRAKSLFLSHLSHELRTPLNAVIGFAQLLSLNEEAKALPQVGRYSEHILDGGKHLLGMVEDLLEVSNIEAGRFNVDLSPTLLDSVIADSISLVQSTATKSGVSIHWEEQSTGLVVLADAKRLRQVFVNLLGNAILYNREGGWVRIAARLVESQVHVLVEDSGVGMSPEQVAQLFTPFNRLGREGGTAKGLGVGLALSRRFIDKMGGRIDVSSAVGEGSRFTVVLACAEPHPLRAGL